MGLRKKENADKKGTSIQLIVKSNNLVEARYMMNIWETRVFLTLLSMITEHDTDDQLYRVWYGDMKKRFGLKSNTSYNDLRMGAIGLTRKTVYLDWTTEDDFDRQITTHLVEGVDTLKAGQEKKRGVGKQEYVDLKLGSSIRPHLLEIKKRLLSNEKLTKDIFQELGVSGYTSYDMRNVAKLKPYGVRLFEIMKKYEKTGYWVVTVDTLRKMFVLEDEYKKFGHLFNAVIKRSITDINKHTDVFVYGVDKIKQGRKVARLKFHIRKKTEEEISEIRVIATSSETKNEEGTVIEQPSEADILYATFEEVVVKDFGVTPSVFMRMLASGNYTKKSVEQAIEVTRRAKFNQEIKKSIAGFFITSLKDEFTDVKVEQKKKQAVKKNQQELLKKQLADLESEYLNKRQEKIKELVQQDETINERTLTYIREKKKISLLRRLNKMNLSMDNITIQDFRDDKILRKYFINGIVETNQDDFAELNKNYNSKIQKLKTQIESVGS